jgi:hypothetical protein
MVTASPGLAPLAGSPVLTPREWELVEAMEQRAKAAKAANLVIEARVWRQAAQLVSERLSRLDIDLASSTVFAAPEKP